MVEDQLAQKLDGYTSDPRSNPGYPTRDDLKKILHDTEAKMDNFLYPKRKPDFTYLEYDLMLPIVEVFMFGAEKYGRNDWKTSTTLEDNVEACMRHILKFNQGEILDSESKLIHLAHACTRLLMAIKKYRELA